MSKHPIPTAAAPLWERTAHRIVHSLTEGELEDGARLPSERELCETLAVSRVTLRRALAHLVDEGRIESQHGRGWYVRSREREVGDWPNSLESFTETAGRLGLRSRSRVVEVTRRPATLDEAESLGIAPGADVHHITRIRLLDQVPIAIDHAIVPVAVAPRLGDAAWSDASLYDELAAAGTQLRFAESTIEARAADATDAALLEIRVGAPLLQMHQSVTSTDGRTVLVSTISYAGERYRLRTSFTRP